MAILETDALVLRVVEFGESDVVLHLLTPATARLTAIAKGAKRSHKRFSGAIDLMNRIRIRAERRRPQSMARLEQARLVDAFPALRRDPRRFALGSYLVELVGRLAPEGAGGAEARSLFETTLAVLRAVAERAPDGRLRVLLELRLLDALGLRPELRRCVRCGRDPGSQARIDFHVGEGGPLCGECSAVADALVTVHLGTLRALDRSLALPLAHLERLSLSASALAEARVLLARFLRFHVGLELRSERILDAMLAEPAGRATA